MGFLSRFFSRKKKAEEIEIALDEIASLVEKESSEKIKELELDIHSRLSEIKHLLSEAKAMLSELESEKVQAKNKRLGKIVETSRATTIKKMRSLLVKLEPPLTASLEEDVNYCLNAESLLKKEISSFGKNIAYTGIVLKERIKNLGQVVSSIEKILSELKKTISENKALLSVEKIKHETKVLQELIERKKSAEESLKETEQKLEAQKKEIERITNSIKLTQSSKEFRELASIIEREEEIMVEKGRLKEKFTDLVGGIEKPLKRLQKMVESKRYFLNANGKETLREFLEEPFSALKKDPKGERFKLLLSELEKAIESNEMHLKEKDLSKKTKLIKELEEFNFTENFFWKENELEKELLKLEERKKSIKVKSEIEQKEKELSEARLKERELRELLGSNGKRLAELEQSIASTKKQLENLLSGILQKRVSIKIPAKKPVKK